MNRLYGWMGGSALVLLAGWTGFHSAQSPDNNPNAPKTPAAPPPALPAGSSSSGTPLLLPRAASASPEFVESFAAPARFGNYRNSPISKASEGLNQAKAALKKAETEEDKKKADEMLVKALNEYFEQDLVQRKKELADIKKKVEELEKQLQKRESSKTDIVDLQKKVIINEVNGLGFYGNINSNPFLIPNSFGPPSALDPLNTTRPSQGK